MIQDIYQVVSYIFVIIGFLLAIATSQDRINKKYLVYWSLIACLILFNIYMDFFNVHGTEYT